MNRAQRRKQRINVDDLLYIEEIISIDEWHEEWEVCPIQRDHEERAKKPKHRQKFSKLESSHLEVDGAILTKDCYDPETKQTYKAGTKFKTNGHTRDAHWWSDDTADWMPEKVRVKYKKHEDMASIYKEYLMHDNPDDAEIASDRVDGAYRAVFGDRQIVIKDGKLRKVEPIQFAAIQCFPNKYTTKMKTNTVNIKLWVSDIEDAILWVRSIFLDDEFDCYGQTNLPHYNPFTWAYFVSFMKHKDDPEALAKLKDLILRVSNYEMVINPQTMREDRFNTLNWLMREWQQLKAGTSRYVQTAAMNGNVPSQNMKSFTLMCIDYYIEGKYFSKDGSMRGVNWKQYLNEWELAYKVSHGMTTSTEVSTLPFEFFPDDEEEDVA
ncbi:hypothetical protein SSSM5_060 [Synechococcus phage S-SSM5]|jgi:hypothetical protein|uniref:Uncharacterized protein n=1 Tax=Synechococcus phage S-SSM5 TaxID=445685 RepID=E3SKA0_9CAUD|nr:hypothetical protein SSSM5_060 [Synechococcus phage S-SSM5]ADO98010.1 hypothetical protein SSSM5_060 [Synechococcus phage S-SSM5]|tara:strand:+ start:3907 stop:5046 length:1140 start_codon:yes stop_codon:yes gene_type:complete